MGLTELLVAFEVRRLDTLVIHTAEVFQIPRSIKMARLELEQLLHLAYIIYSVSMHINKAREEKAQICIIFILGHPSFALASGTKPATQSAVSLLTTREILLTGASHSSAHLSGELRCFFSSRWTWHSCYPT